ncbi:Uncharacterized protein TCM_023896 [Theobroma cacao]|uniref:Uncharacterized protein n=1 Tax=Theobroma cacao TaxID=3641 RepID=A0A061EVU9_THECC|nr:Uncharacterized protein TCM_023896 [Theobroma cacao]
MSRKDNSPDAPHSASEGSLDSTAMSQWHPNLGTPRSDPSRIPINWIPLELEEWFRNKESFESSESLESEDNTYAREWREKCLKEWHKEQTKEVITKENIHPRKVSVVRHFPLGCGRGAATVSREKYIRIQQAWVKAKMEKSQEVEEDPEQDPSMCSDQGDEDLKDT